MLTIALTCLIVQLQIARQDTLPVQKDVPCALRFYPDRIDPRSAHHAVNITTDSIIYVSGGILDDYRVIGYEKPDTCSKRLIIFSVFTRDVENNPYGCLFGAYYSTANDRFDNWKIKYVGKTKYFIKAELIREEESMITLFFERRWVRIDK